MMYLTNDKQKCLQLIQPELISRYGMLRKTRPRKQATGGSPDQRDLSFSQKVEEQALQPCQAETNVRHGGKTENNDGGNTSNFSLQIFFSETGHSASHFVPILSRTKLKQFNHSIGMAGYDIIR